MFQCDKCGACCRNLRLSSLYKELDRGDGVCKYLDGNLCSIYDNRPLICRVDDSYNVLFKDKLSREEYYRLNYESCIKLKTTIGENKDGEK